MMSLHPIVRIGCRLAVLACVTPLVSAQTVPPDEHGFITAQPQDLLPPEGSRSVRILGNPAEPGPYVMRITFAPGTGTRPHVHDQARYITVIEGTWWVARGPDATTYDPTSMTPVTAGSFLYQPAHGIHYDEARDEAVTVQISGMGPMRTTRLEEPPAVTGPEPAFTSRVVATGLEFPWEVTWGPDDHLWVTERAGKRIVRIDPVDGARAVALELPEAYQAVLQDGVLGLALHPELLAETGHDYVYVAWNYDADESDAVDVRARIQRYTYDPTRERLETPIDLIAGLPAHDDHLGGRLVIGDDRRLYFSIGDQGGNWQRNRCNPILSQVLPTADDIATADWTRYQGKILRLELDGSIPDDNPVIDGVRTHVYSYGHRNPQGLVLDADGTLFAAEHGPSTDDEVNRIEPGGNYGWPRVAGRRDDQAYVYANWSASSPTPCEELGNRRDPPPSVPTSRERNWSHVDLRPPLATLFTVGDDYDFATNGAATVAASGLDLYTHTSGVPGWADSLLLAALTRGVIYRLPLSDDHARVVGDPIPTLRSTNRYRDIAVRPDGKAFYVVTDNVGPTRDERGARTRELENPGAILEFVLVD